VAEGKDPRREREHEERQRAEAAMNTFASCAAAFMEQHARVRLRHSTQKEYRRVLMGSDTRRWGDRPIGEISKRDVLDVLTAIEQRGSPGAAKRTLAYLRKFFNWCADRDMVEAPPTARVPPPHPEVRRDRVLTDEELRELLSALTRDQSMFAPVVRLLLLTGQRRAEVAGMRWAELRELDARAGAIWEIPGGRTKNKLTHLVPLSRSAVRLIKEQQQTSDFVFSTTGRTAVSGLGKAKHRLDEIISARRQRHQLQRLPPWTLHDLRRTMVTVMNEKLSIPPHVVEAVVNHTSGLAKAGVAGVYNRALYLYERRAALDRWAGYVKTLDRRGPAS
jgi:integrase